MIREMLPDMTDEEFREVMEITTDDIRENRTKFGKETDLEEVLTIAKRSLKVLRKCNKVIERSGEMENKYIKISFEGDNMGIETSKDGVDNSHVLCAIIGLVDMAKDFGLNM